MKMAKANEADIEMSMELTNALEALCGHWPAMPTALCDPSEDVEDERFDSDDREQCHRALNHLLSLAQRASLMRVVLGCAVMLDPQNQCVDPAADTIEHHPNTKLAIAAKNARLLADWHEDTGNVLWWTFQVNEPPWCGQPTDNDWPNYHTHWTPLIVPDAPPRDPIDSAMLKARKGGAE